MFLKKLIVGEMETNCYILGCEKTKKSVVIDPGGDCERIKKNILKNSLEVVYIINTHGHIDHIVCNKEIKDFTGAQILIHSKDADMLCDENLNLSIFLNSPLKSPSADKLLNNNDFIEFGEIILKVIHTPGHSSGSISLSISNMIFTGDTLFANGFGRYDLPGSSYQDLVNSITQKLFCFEDDIIIYPGHGESSFIGKEKQKKYFV
ncbi:MAG: MBL fold metallo-hydrolase [bacterium]